MKQVPRRASVVKDVPAGRGRSLNCDVPRARAAYAPVSRAE